MSKEITRTINSTEVEFNAFDLEKEQICKWFITIAGKHTEKDKVVEKAIKDEEKKYNFIRILNPVKFNVVSGLYAMSEETFLMYAERIGDGR